MTEAEWLACRSPFPLLVWVRRLANGRRHRLFNVACCNRIASLLALPGDQACLKSMEAFADCAGIDPTPTVERAVEIARAARQTAFSFRRFQTFRVQLKEFVAAEGRVKALGAVAACGRLSCEACWESLVAYRYTQVWENRAGRRSASGARRDERAAHARLVRDVFGNPFRPINFSPEWRTDTALSLARHIYESRDFSAMPILADALQDAGCESDAILNHCRGDGAHVRGCWVVDAVLGKA